MNTGEKRKWTDRILEASKQLPEAEDEEVFLNGTEFFDRVKSKILPLLTDEGQEIWVTREFIYIHGRSKEEAGDIYDALQPTLNALHRKRELRVKKVPSVRTYRDKSARITITFRLSEKDKAAIRSGRDYEGGWMQYLPGGVVRRRRS